MRWVPAYLQPHEGVIGTDQPRDARLVLEDEFLSLRERVWDIAYQLYKSSLGQRTTDLFQRMTHPEVGDWVIVADAYGRDAETKVKGSGILVEHRAEWWTSDEEWQAELETGDPNYHDEERPVEPDAWYIQYGPSAADICRWVDCQVLTIPI
jgi:hypothetical protein